jgi:hypothetical protein
MNVEISSDGVIETGRDDISLVYKDNSGPVISKKWLSMSFEFDEVGKHQTNQMTLQLLKIQC